MKKQIDRVHTLTLKLSEVAKDFGYKIEADPYEDVYYEGDSLRNIRNMDMVFSDKLEGVNKYFPSIVANALETAERVAIAEQVRKNRLSALEQALLKIDLGGSAEYQEMEGSWITASAAITDVSILNESDDEITITMKNPEHLINAVIAGVGMFSPDLDAFEPESDKNLIAKFHNLSEYFSVYGDSKPDEGDVRYWDIDQESFYSDIEDQLSQLSVSDVAEAVIDLAEESDEDVVVSEFTKYALANSEEAIKKEVQEILKQRSEDLVSKIK